MKPKYFGSALVALFVILIFSAPTIAQTPIFINELHYDNAGGDVGEGVEVAGPAGTDLTGWDIVAYNGASGASYSTTNLSGLIPDLGGGFGTVFFAIGGLQNGSPDGVALVDGGTLVQFLSYEGTFTGTNGPANGVLSTDIGVTEGGGTPIGFSLQLGGSGTDYEDFTWQTEAASTYDAFNNGQTFVLPYPTPPGSGDALAFDGVDDYVSIGNVAALNYGKASTFTLEAWINTAVGGDIDIISKYDGALFTTAGWVFQHSATNNSIAVFMAGGFFDYMFIGPTGAPFVADGNWHHVAVAYDGTNAATGFTFYVDGVSFAGIALSIFPGPVLGTVTNAHSATIGAYEVGGPAEFWDGSLDEIRTWSATLTQTEIRDYMCQKDVSAHPQIANIDVLYRFDDGTGSGTLVDIQGANDGTLTNMDPATDWVTSGAAIGDESSQGYGVATVTHTSGTSFTADTYTGAPAGVHVYKVNEAPNDVTVPAGFVSMETSEYYGVFLAGGAAPTYTGTLNYTTNANIDGQPNEADVRLTNRADNAGGAFADIITQTLDAGLNTISAPNQTGTEFIPGFAMPPAVTEVQFQAPLSASVPEALISTDLILEIANPSGSNATDVDVVLISGDPTRINNYTTQNISWLAGDGTTKTVTISMTDDPACTGHEILVFELQNINGGDAAVLGTNTQFTLTVLDAQTSITSLSDDFESGTIAGWTEGTPGDWAASATLPINGAFSLKHNLSGTAGSSYISQGVNSDFNNGDNTWRLQMKNGNWDPSGGNRFWFWLAANDADLSSAAIDGYVVGVNVNGSDDLLKLWRIDNNGATAIVTSAFNWNADDIVGIEVTRNTSGDWELLFDANGGFDALVSAGTVNDVTYNTMTDLGVEFVFTATRAGLFWVDDVSYNQTYCQFIYYSQASGNVSDPIWDIVPVGVGGPATFDQTTSMVIQNVDAVNNDLGALSVRNFELLATASFTTVDPVNDVIGVWGVSSIFSTSHPVMNLEFNSPFASNFSQGTDLILRDVVSNGAGVDFNNTSLSVSHELNVNSGVFDANNRPIVLESDINGTALIGDLSNGTLTNATNTTIERYIPAGVTNWRNLGTSVSGATLEDWDSDFFTSGIPNSDYPVFIVNGSNWPSIYQYDENLAAVVPDIDDGFVAPTDMNNAFVDGAGYWVWCGDTLQGTAAFTIDATGTPLVGPQALPLVNSLPIAPTAPQFNNMGWNMVSNPLPSPVDFTSFTLGGNIENKYWIYDPVTGVTALWDEGLGTSVPALVLNGNIQSSQGMWMHAFDQGPISAVVNEFAKIDDASANGVFGGFTSGTDPALRVEVTSNMNAYLDEVLVLFTPAGSDGRDMNDAIKLYYGYYDAPMLSTRSSENIDLTLNDMGSVATGMEIPMKLNTAVYGEYTFRIYDLIDPSALGMFVLEDLQTGTVTPITEGATYTFTTAASDMELRFLIHSLEPTVSLAMKVLLEGPYNSGSGLMNDDLRTANYIPTTEPFTALGFVQVNSGSETIDDGVLAVSGNDAVVDWVLVELRDQNNNSIIVSTVSALVQRDGDIVAMDGISPIEIIGAEGEYFVAVRHRNHLGAMAMNTFYLNDVPTVINLTDSSVPTYGTEAQKALNGGIKVLWAGNVEPDAAIKYTGINNDRDPILTAIGGAVPTATATGYLLEDVDMDGVVKYTGTNNDRDVILINIGGTVPTNTRVEQLP